MTKDNTVEYNMVEPTDEELTTVPVATEELDVGVEAPDFDPIELELKAREEKKQQLENLEVDTNGIPFNADRVAISNMNAVTTIANWKFNQAIAPTFKMVAGTQKDPAVKAMFEGISAVLEQIYTDVYKTKIEWKGADNKVHEVQAETIAESLEKAMKKLATIVTK